VPLLQLYTYIFQVELKAVPMQNTTPTFLGDAVSMLGRMQNRHEVRNMINAAYLQAVDNCL